MTRAERIHVAHVGDYDPDSANGVNKTLAGLVMNLAAENVVPEVWHLSNSAKSIRETTRDGVAIFDLPRRDRPSDVVWRLPRPTSDFLRQRSKEVDLVHFHSVFIPSNVKAARVITTPYAVTPNGGYSSAVLQGRFRILKSGWMKIAEREFVQRAALLHAVSEAEAAQLQGVFGCRSVIVPNGVDAAAPDAAPRGGVGTQATRLLFMGRLAIDHKGLDLLLEGMAVFHRDHPNDEVILTIAGPDFRDGRARLEQLAKNLDIADKVEFVGPVFGPHKTRLMIDCDAFVHTSRWEGVPFSILEALALGKRVLVTPETNVATHVGKYDAGVVVLGDAKSIASGIAEMVGMGVSARARQEAAARALAEEVFSWKSIARRIADAYRAVVRSPVADSPP